MRCQWSTTMALNHTRSHGVAKANAARALLQTVALLHLTAANSEAPHLALAEVHQAQPLH